MHGSLERMKTIANPQLDAVEASSGRAALHKASFFGHAHVVEYLCAAGAKVNLADADGDTPLHDGARFGHASVVEALLKAGADKTIQNGAGKTALDLAKENEKAAVVAMLS